MEGLHDALVVVARVFIPLFGAVIETRALAQEERPTKEKLNDETDIAPVGVHQR